MSIATCQAAVALFFATALPLTASAGTLTTLYTFKDKSDGGSPFGPLIYLDGSLYGTTTGGLGTASGYGNVFKVDVKTGRFRVVHTFTNGLDGAYPIGGVIYLGGSLYGTTEVGGGDGCTGGCGTIFSINPKTDSETILYTDFSGAGDFNQLIYLDGFLYGTTPYGGANSVGSVFSFNLATNAFTTVHSFSGGGDGSYANAGLLYHDGLLNGTTAAGGGGACYDGGCGTLFSIDPASGAETVLHAFAPKKDGAAPFSNLIYHGGSFIGATLNGGNRACKHGCGVIFSIDAATGKETVLHLNDSYSETPSELTLQDGHAYETLSQDFGANGDGPGQIVELDMKSGTQTILYSFTGGTDGLHPESPLLYHDGAFYGTTYAGGKTGICFANQGCGTVFRFVP